MTIESTPVRAITFDFWRTLFYADVRLRERRNARVETVQRATGLAPRPIKDALKLVAAEYLRIHIEEQRTLEPIHAIPLLEQHLGITLEDASGLAEELADAVLHHPPDPIEGALEAVRAAARLVPVGIISDTGLSPGSHIEALLERHGFLGHLRSLTFSDAVGAAKPQPAMFADAAANLNVEPAEMLHIGDLEPTDVKGALEFGARAALFAGDNNRYAEGSQAHYVFSTWSEFQQRLPEIVG